MYNALALPNIDYCCVIGMEYGVALSGAMWLITSSPHLACRAELRSRLKWMTLEQRRKLFRLALVYKCLLGRAPQYLYFKFASS